MTKFLKYGLLATLFMVLGFVAYLYFQVRSLDVEALDEGLFVLRGVGGNATVLSTPAGAVVVDSMTFPLQGGLIREKAEQLTGQKVALVINTHYHLDHTHGNPGFDPGTKIVSTARTLSHLKALDADFWEGDHALMLPNETFSDERVFDLGGVKLTVKHLGRGHTDGDLVVFLHTHQTVVMGDLFFNKHYPNIDLEAGGSVQQWPATLNAVMEHDFSRVIPGHGNTTDRHGLRQFQTFMSELAKIGQTAANSEASLESTLAKAQLTSDQGYQEIAFAGFSLGLDREFVITRAWEEATNRIELAN